MYGKYADSILKPLNERINFSSNRLVPLDAMNARFGESKDNKTDSNSPWKLGPGINYSKVFQSKLEEERIKANNVQKPLSKANSAEILKKYDKIGRVWYDPVK